MIDLNTCPPAELELWSIPGRDLSTDTRVEMSAALIRVLGLGFLWRLGSPLASATAWSSWFAALFVAVWWSVLATVRARSAPSPLGSLCLWQRRGRVYSPCLIALVAARVRVRSVACCFADLLAPVRSSSAARSPHSWLSGGRTGHRACAVCAALWVAFVCGYSVARTGHCVCSFICGCLAARTGRIFG